MDFIAYRFSQPVASVEDLVDGQQVAVLSVEEKEKAVEEDQGGLADILQFCAAFLCKSADQGGVDPCEDGAGKIVGDLFLVAEPFGEGILKEAGLGAMSRAEGGATK